MGRPVHLRDGIHPGSMAMTGNIRKKTQRTICFITVILALLGTNTFALQEEKISTLSDYLYNKDLQKYKEIQAATDNQKKIDLATAFLKERPISRVLLYVATEYMTAASKIAGNNSNSLIKMGEALWNLVPTDQKINAEAKDIPVGLEEFKKEQLQKTRILILEQIAGAYYKTQNYAKAAEYVERIDAINPSAKTAQSLFDIYGKLGNEDKRISYGKKVLERASMKSPEGYGMALQLADIYLKKQDASSVNAAIQLFTKVMDVYGNSVPPNVRASEWDKTRIFAYTLMAKDAYSKNDFAKAEKMFQTVLSFNDKLDEPYYYLGMCKWKEKDQPTAIVYFARCAVLNKDYAAKANKYLQDLYKATYPNDPDGLKDVIAKAKTALGIS
jgi:tetratricopeptide (TPR) repeat protein